MNRLEFEKVMETTGIKNVVGTHYGWDDAEGNIYKWNDFKFMFPGSYYTIIEGYVPFDLVNKLFENIQITNI